MNDHQDTTSLCPGYVQVEHFADDSEYEDEVEVSYVTLDLGSVEPTLVPSSSSYRLIGLDTPTPYLQLSGSVFRGRHDRLLGTEMIFTDTALNQDRAKRGVSHVANTDQRIQFKEVLLRPKSEQVENEPKPLPKRIPLGIEPVEEMNSEEATRAGKRRSERSTRSRKGKQKERHESEGMDEDMSEGQDDIYRPNEER